MLAKRHLQLSMFLNAVISSQSGGDNAIINSFVRSVMRAIEMGNPRAALLFPRVLEVVESLPLLHAEFASAAEHAPVSLLSRWRTQLIGFLFSGLKAKVVPLLVKVAVAEPQAFFYAFNTAAESSPNLRKDAAFTLLFREMERPVGRLQRQFISALEALTHPELTLKQLLNEMKGCVSRRKLHDAKTRAVAIVAELDAMVARGAPHHVKIEQKLRKLVDKTFGERLEKVEKLAEDALTNLITTVVQLAADASRSAAAGMRLPVAHMSAFLAAYDGSKPSEAKLEIPCHGGTNGVDLVSVSPELLVLLSMRLPKRIIMNGADEREYAFVVKGGEDLRLDERVMQMFDIMNNLLAFDGDCSRDRLRVRTYGVVPMSTSVGVLEWVGGTRTLADLIESQLTSSTKPIFAKAGDPIKALHKDVKTVADVARLRAADVVAAFSKAEASVPQSYLMF